LDRGLDLLCDRLHDLQAEQGRVKPRPGLPEGPWLVVGLARSGVAAALALRAHGEQVLGLDSGSPAGLEELAQVGVELHLGVDGVALLEKVRAVVKSPGVPAQAPVIEAGRANGLPVMGELELGWRLLKNEFVAVTGTNGKTTTVELIGHIHREAGLQVAVAGNVGAAVSGLVGKVDANTTIVCEVSSFQLEDTLAFAPEAAVLLNLAPDHLDRHGTMEAYTAAKLKVFAHQTQNDIAVVPGDLDIEIPGAARRARWDQVQVHEMGLRGRHNLQNATAAAAVCLARGIDVEAVRAGLRTFKGVKHRLEEVAQEEGVVYVNDSKATNVASTLVALDVYRPGVVHLILGGQGKDQEFSALRDPVKRSCKAIYLIGEDAPKIAAALGGLGVPVHECGDLERAVTQAREAARYGDVVLLSPACASFDQFADYEARGQRFRELARR
jgi:UDP-N-acetylmuramoylalanine--D-glutamate ligase